MSFQAHLTSLLDSQPAIAPEHTTRPSSSFHRWSHDVPHGVDPISGLTSETLVVGASRRLHLLRADGRAPTWVILPALGLPAAAYAPVLRMLHGDRAGCAVDLAGFGISRAETSSPSYAQHLCMVLSALGSISGPLVLVGHSVCAGLAIEIARRRPDRVRALVLSGYGRLESGGHWRRQLRLGASHPERLLYEHATSQSDLLPQIRSALREGRTRPAYESFFDELGVTALRSGLRGIHLPTLLLHGESDAIIGRDLLDAAAADTPDARVHTLARCSHLAPIERPDAFVRTALEFVSARPTH